MEKEIKLPFTLRFPLQKALEALDAANYDKAKNHQLDFIEMGVMWLTHLLFVMLSNEAEAAEVCAAHARLLVRKRPLSMGDWVAALTPLLVAAEQILPEHPLVISLAENLLRGSKRKRRNALLGDGKMPGPVTLRNTYKGHGVTRSDEKNRELTEKLQVYVDMMAAAVAPLQYATVEAPDLEADANAPVLKDESGPVRGYVLSFADGALSAESINMYPLFFHNSRGVPFILQTLMEGGLAQYLTSDADTDPQRTDLMNSAIDRRMKMVWPQFSVETTLTWEELCERLQGESTQYLNRVYKEKKYNQELFVERQTLTGVLHRFWVSPKTLFPMVGEAGQGKTNQLCHWTEGLIAQGKAVLVFNAADFAEISLDARMKSILGFGARYPMEKVMASVHKLAEERGEDIYVLFDAVNECLHYAPDAYAPAVIGDEEAEIEGPLELFRAIRRLFVGEGMSRFKVLFTCRTYTWKNVLQPTLPKDDPSLFGVGEEEAVVRGFSDEEAERAYQIYRRLFQMHTDFADLPRGIRLRLKDPLILKYVATNYLGQPLVKDSNAYTSTSLFALMLSEIANSYAGQQQVEIIHRMGAWMLGQYLQGMPVDGLGMNALRQAEDGSELALLRNLTLKADGISIAYGELLNRAERSVLRESEKNEGENSCISVQFVYERFLEYVMAEQFVEQQRKSLDPTLPIPPSTYIDAIEHAAMNVVMMGVLRNSLIIDLLHTGSTETIVELAARHTDDFRVMMLVSETIDTLIRENYEQYVFTLMDAMLQPLPDEADTLRLRKVASSAIVNGILLTDYFNESLYSHDAMQLLWRLMLDPLTDVSNNACMYAYYLSNHRHTLGYLPIRDNLTRRIVEEMYGHLKASSVFSLTTRKEKRREAMVFMETATRLCVLLIIDNQLAISNTSEPHELQRLHAEVGYLMDSMRDIVRHFTWNYRVIRLIMPFLQTAMRTQITFQGDYVNNAAEYQGCWDDNVVPAHAAAERWSRDSLAAMTRFFTFYHQFEGCYEGNPEAQTEAEAFRSYIPTILDAYSTGDSLSYFVLERTLVIVGSRDWTLVRPIINGFFSDRYRQTEWFRYSQMSILYVLLQIQIHSGPNPEVEEIYAREAEDWTRACRGLFPARNSKKANPTGLYKRNVLTWYAVVETERTADGIPRVGEPLPVPLIYRLIDEAVADRDKELLYHIVENISEMIADFGLIRTGLDLLKTIMLRFDSEEKVEAFDAIDTSARGGIYTYDLVRLVGNVLSTAKNYYGAQIDAFIRTDIAGLAFPGVSTYHEDILSYHPSGETLSDLFTHKFGKFLMWSLMNIPEVDAFSAESIKAIPAAHNCFGWYEGVVKILMRHLFGVKV
ncbi:MAG: hypothetical protein K6F94_08510 [Bacteroidaceae bacterium]|nr:hypothetical protein [Bacteroidaceae bacterium]